MIAHDVNKEPDKPKKLCQPKHRGKQRIVLNKRTQQRTELLEMAQPSKRPSSYAGNQLNDTLL